jgi:hypothetical protein
MLRQHLPKALAALMAGSLVVDASASWRDKISPFVSETVTRDDNVFRLPDGRDPVLALGEPSASDVYHSTSAGLGFDIMTDAQRFQGQLALDRYRFSRFSELDFNGYNARAVWNWRAGDRFNGDVGHDSSQLLASLSNVQNGTRSTVPNILDLRHTYVTAIYTPTSKWEVAGEVREASQRNRALTYLPNNLDESTKGLSLAYVTDRMTRIGLSVTDIDGRLPVLEPLGTLRIDNSYTQHSVAAFIDWRPSAHSQIKASTGPTDRNYVDLPRRDFSHNTHRVSFDWQPTDEITLTALSRHEISTAEEINVDLVWVEGVTFSSRWQIRENSLLSLDLERADRTYLGQAGVALTLGAPYAERVRSVGGRLALHPRKPITVDIGLRHERRSSLTSLGSYTAGIASVGFRYAF